MRPVMLSDLTTTARALLRVPMAERRALCERIVCEAKMADRFTRRLQKQHPEWGNGTLVSASSKCMLAAERACDDPEYCACLTMVLHAISGKEFVAVV
jgi:hypothetical protein